MSSFLRSAHVTVLLLLTLMAFGDDTKPPAMNPELRAADQLYRAGKFAEAEAGYQALLKPDAKLEPAELTGGCCGEIGVRQPQRLRVFFRLPF